MRLFALITLCLAGAWGCSKHSFEPAAAAPPLPAVQIEEVPAPAAVTVRVEPGMHLEQIAFRQYGHEKYADWIAQLNGLPDPGQLPAGKELSTPSLPKGLLIAGLDAKFQPAINVLGKAVADFHKELPAYLHSRHNSRVKAGHVALPESVQNEFVHIADAITSACQILAKTDRPHHAPEAALGQFQKAAHDLRWLSEGAIDQNGYDYDMIDQRLALGFAYLLVWVQNQHR